ncbi:GTPase HflX [Ahniella affigens]|uniref:GTPase HflX n=1 Tax=Ahniella affigens TaxID=2021234 RepID=A0A2P1PT47_9GAMM|nr:ribosome rescue GTPase HflX [Ahniella affigens]AVP98014.1 GTPase HflX [Ahniella affigens]
MDFFHRARGGERALLVQPVGAHTDDSAAAEFEELARSAGASVLGVITGRLDRPNPRFLIGTGKADEIRDRVEAEGADLVLINATLSPVQERNLESHCKCRVVDRTGLILDIFAQRARSHEGKLQVELAQLKHLATRLAGGWTHLERQRGGAIGLRGPGETQLELDRRLLSERVKMLESRLEKVEVQRQQAKRRRERQAVPVVTLAGYTNAGKSTLFNALTEADVYAADQLFATLDPTLRKLEGLNAGDVLLADTVGFVRDLPHDLVVAFRSTLSEVRDADLILHVIDASDPERDARIEQVNAVLAEIGAADVPQILVFNKIDLVDGLRAKRHRASDDLPERVLVSAMGNQGLPLLRAAIDDFLSGERIKKQLKLTHSQARLRARLFDAGVVAHETITETGWTLKIEAPKARLTPLLGLADGDGIWLGKALKLD